MRRAIFWVIALFFICIGFNAYSTSYSVTNGNQIAVDTSGDTQVNNLKITSITGSTQCLHTDTSGNVTGTGSDCGSGGGGSGTVTSITASSPLTGGTITTSGSIGIPQATTSVSGYLTNSDWTTFNGKQANLSLAAGTYVNGDVCTYSSSGTLLNCNTTPSGSGTVTSITASSPLTGGTITGSGSIGIPQANGSTNGYLASGDWTTFNGKQSTLSQANGSTNGYLASGDWTTFNGKQANLSLAAGTYVNGDVCTYSSSGTLLNCNTTPSGSGTVTSITATSPLTGGTITGSGSIGIPAATTSANGYLTSTDWNTFNGKQSSLSLASGTYTNGGVCTYTTSGTLLNCNSSYAPQTSGSSILYGNGSGGFSNVTVGTNLTFSGGTLSASGGSGSGTVNSGTANQVAYYNTTGTAVSGSSILQVVGSNVGIGSATPGATLDVNGTVNLTNLTGTGASSGLSNYLPTNLGIGSTSPGQALDVNGTVRATNFSGAGTSLTGTAASLTAGNVTTNANLTGPITSSGNATSITAQTGTGTTFAMQASPSFTGNVGIGTTVPGSALQVSNTISFASEYSNGNSGTALTVNWNNGNRQKVTMSGNCTFTFTAPTSGVANVLLELDQNGTGGYTATWPSTVFWPGGSAPTLSTAANAIDIITCFYNRTDYYCTGSMNMQV